MRNIFSYCDTATLRHCDMSHVKYIKSLLSTVTLQLPASTSRTLDKAFELAGTWVTSDDDEFDATHVKIVGVSIPSASQGGEYHRRTKKQPRGRGRPRGYVHGSGQEIRNQKFKNVISCGVPSLPFQKSVSMVVKVGNKKTCKVRWFLQKNILHISVGLPTTVCYWILQEVASHIPNAYYVHRKDVLANGLAQWNASINLSDFAKWSKNTLSYPVVYAPEIHAPVKIYVTHKNSERRTTVMVFSTGKIMYMGSKTTLELHATHTMFKLVASVYALHQRLL